MMKLEIPFSPEMVRAFWLATGGSILAARNALRDRVGFNIGGGFHHAFAGHGEGFCAINDVAVAIRALQHEGLIERAHGGGSATCTTATARPPSSRGDASVFTLSIHQFNNYPSEKPESVIDIHLRDGVGDEEYLSRLEDALPVAMGFRAESRCSMWPAPIRTARINSAACLSRWKG